MIEEKDKDLIKEIVREAIAEELEKFKTEELGNFKIWPQLEADSGYFQNLAGHRINVSDGYWVGTKCFLTSGMVMSEINSVAQNWTPNTDNAWTLGSATYAWKGVYSSDGYYVGAICIITSARVACGFLSVAQHWNPNADNTYTLGVSTGRWSNIFLNRLSITDGITAPSAITGYTQIYVDTADGDLKVIFGDGTIKTLATDT